MRGGSDVRAGNKRPIPAVVSGNSFREQKKWEDESRLPPSTLSRRQRKTEGRADHWTDRTVRCSPA